MTPILTTLSEICACAPPDPKPTLSASAATPASNAVIVRFIVIVPLLNPEIALQLVDARLELVARNGVDHAPVLDHVVAVGHRRGEAEVLLDQQDGEARGLE